MSSASAWDEVEAWVRLGLIPGVSGHQICLLLRALGTPERVLAATGTELSAIVGDKPAQAIANGADAARVASALVWLTIPGNHLLSLADADYPAALLEIADPPPLLYLKGRRELLMSPGIAIVGSRSATPPGKQTAEAFARAFSEAGLTVISGLALGIDTAAHRGGLDGAASSIAVVGTGLDRVYPARNRALAQELAQRGLIISEFPLGTPAMAHNFPRRNRLISGLSRGVLVVEAAIASGSLITARVGAEQGRDVFAIPGSIHSPVSKGCHLLIKQGAKLVDDVNDVLSELSLPLRSPSARAVSPTPAISAAHRAILDAMGFDAVSTDALLERLTLGLPDLLAALAELEISGAIVSVPGGRFQRAGA